MALFGKKEKSELTLPEKLPEHVGFITDISLFFGVSCDEIVDIIIEEYKKEEFVLHVDKEIEEKVIFLTRGKQTLEECLQATGKYVPSYLVKLVLLKRGFDYE